MSADSPTPAAPTFPRPEVNAGLGPLHAPTPAAPAGAAQARPKLTDDEYAALEWLDGECHSGPLEARALRSYLRALLARAEAAERERDEARALIVKERAGGDADREWLTTERDEARAALAASTEREAALRELCEDYQVQAELFSGDGCHLDPTLAELRSRLASLAAPEGGTSRPTPPEGTNGE